MELRQHPHFTEKSVNFAVADVFGVKFFHGDTFSRSQVVREPDLAKCTFSDLFDELEVLDISDIHWKTLHKLNNETNDRALR